MITPFLGHICTDFFNRNLRFEDLHTLSAVVILDGFCPARPFLGGKIILQWAETSNVLLAVKYLGETKSANEPSGASGHLTHGIRSPLDNQTDAGAAQQR